MSKDKPRPKQSEQIREVFADQCHQLEVSLATVALRQESPALTVPVPMRCRPVHRQEAEGMLAHFLEQGSVPQDGARIVETLAGGVVDDFVTQMRSLAQEGETPFALAPHEAKTCQDLVVFMLWRGLANLKDGRKAIYHELWRQQQDKSSG